MVATGHLPEMAILYSALATLPLASAAPRSSSARQCLRKVFGERIPISCAISVSRRPNAAMDLTWRRCSSEGWNLGRAILHLLRRQAQFAGNLREGVSIHLQHGLLAAHLLPTCHDPVSYTHLDFQAAADALGQLGGDQRGTRTQKRIVDQVASHRVIQDRSP